jgi:hypothetical protein
MGVKTTTTVADSRTEPVLFPFTVATFIAELRSTGAGTATAACVAFAALATSGQVILPKSFREVNLKPQNPKLRTSTPTP